MNGDGIADDTGWVGKGDGFLVIDRNKDGLITDASELSFATENKAARSDLEALAALDNNGDRVLNKDDARFGELKVWVDANGNGITDAGELKTLSDLGITEISLIGRNIDGTAKVGDNVLISTATFKRENGTVGTLGNAALAYKPGQANAVSALAVGDPVNRFELTNPFVPNPLDLDMPAAAEGAAVAPELGNPAATLSAFEALSFAQLPNSLSAVSAMIASGSGQNLNVFDYFEQLDAVAGIDRIAQSGSSTASGIEYGENERSVQDVTTRSVEERAPAMRAAKIALLANQLVPAPVADHRLALMVQDMAAFGRRGGENDLARRSETVNPVDYFV
jgi:hypothetical protein